MMWGMLEVNKVSGNFHIAVGHAENRDSRHVHSFSSGEVFKFNATHHIEKYAYSMDSRNRLSFGNFIPGVKNPLDKHDMVAEQCIFCIRMLP